MKFYESILANIKSFFGMEPDATEAEVDAKLDAVQSREAYEAKIREEVKAEYEQQIATLKQEMVENAADLNKQISGLKETIERRDVRIAELEKQPAADHTTGVTETEPAEAAAITWKKHPVNERVKALLAGKA